MDPVTKLNRSYADHRAFVTQSYIKLIHNMDEFDSIYSCYLLFMILRRVLLSDIALQVCWIIVLWLGECVC